MDARMDECDVFVGSAIRVPMGKGSRPAKSAAHVHMERLETLVRNARAAHMGKSAGFARFATGASMGSYRAFAHSANRAISAQQQVRWARMSISSCKTPGS